MATCEMLLHPEFLSNEQLITIILERHLRIPNIEFMSRDQLLDLFHNFCVPYGQRKSRDHGRSSKPKQSTPMEVEDAPYNNRKHNLHHERVKPPPDLLSGHLKRIKIKENLDVRSICSPKEKEAGKRKIESQDTSLSPPTKKERKPITWP